MHHCNEPFKVNLQKCRVTGHFLLKLVSLSLSVFRKHFETPLENI